MFVYEIPEELLILVIQFVFVHEIEINSHSQVTSDKLRYIIQISRTVFPNH